ncbi:DUF3757 domain-containing protein [Pseudomonas fluorescens]|uniref:DUF3757 domain-containing protein n=1 Tax=Pseudomonas fluorescens TaxID=294 RepID=UPI00123FE3B1|nr:DUF3757 domain-containing protein [Pseudomonas fluorescens]
MLKKLTPCLLISAFLASTAHAESCPPGSSFHKLEEGIYTVTGLDGNPVKVNVMPDVDQPTLKSLKFTSARLLNKENSSAKVICRYENSTAGGSLGVELPTGKPVTGAGANWSGNDCVADDELKCAFN